MIREKAASVISKINRVSDRYPIVFPLVLLAFALITYGVFITSLGFYWDDWPPMLLSHIPDKSTVWEYFSYDRPFQSWTYYLLFPICRDSAALWQLSAIFFRWTTALTLYYTFVKVFPRQKNLMQWAAVLFIVFPGFADQYASVSFGSHFAVYTTFGLSLLFMVLAFQKPKAFWIFYPLSVIFTAVHLFPMEYFVGLELVRPVLIYLLLSDPERKKPRACLRTILWWLPYIAVLAFYLYWRMVLYPNSVESVADSNYPYLIVNFLSAPADTLVTFLQSVYSDLRFLFVDIWTDRILPLAIEIKSVTFWLSIIIGIGAALGLHLFFRPDMKAEELRLKGKEIGWNIAVSVIIIFCGIFPIWSTLRQITKGKWSDRFDLPAIFGVLILLLTLAFIVLRNQKTRNVVLILVTGLSISYQIQIGNDYRKDYVQQQAFYTQLAWRVPSLEPGTLVYSPGIPTNKEADYSYTMGINMLFNTGEMKTTLDHWYSGPRYFTPDVLLADPNLEIEQGLRDLQFTGVASKIISIHKPGGGCLWVIDPYYALIPESINQLAGYGELTDQDLIGETESQWNHLSGIIDVSPQNTWCYYFEKGDLAQSKGRYEEAVQYYEDAMAEGLEPLEKIEYLPFVKSYAMLGRIDEAVSLTTLAFTDSRYAVNSICQVWHDVLADDPSIPLSSVESVYNSTNCSILLP